MDPDPGGPKTRGSGGSGFGSATLIIALNWARSLRWLNNVSGVYLIQVSLLLNGEQGLVDFFPLDCANITPTPEANDKYNAKHS